MATYAVASGTILGSSGRLVAAVLLVGALSLVADRAGLGRTDLGLCHLPAGLRWGFAVGLPIAVTIFLFSFAPLPGRPFLDDRYGDMSSLEVLLRAGVRIPLATALFEEYIFRGVLLGLLLRKVTPIQALTISSILFGIWHVFPALGSADAPGGPVGDGWLMVLPITVATTGAAGAYLAWLRIRARSLMAPFLVHTLANSTALVAAHLAIGRGGAG